MALFWTVKRECLEMKQMSYIYLLMSLIFHLRLDVVLTQGKSKNISLYEILKIKLQYPYVLNVYSVSISYRDSDSFCYRSI